MSNENQTIVVFTSRQFWGKANNLVDALKNAKYEGSEKVKIYLAQAPQEDVAVNEGGIIQTPVGTTVFDLTTSFQKLPINPYVGFDKVVRKLDEKGEFDRYFKEDVDSIEYSEELQELKEEELQDS